MVFQWTIVGAARGATFAPLLFLRPEQPLTTDCDVDRNARKLHQILMQMSISYAAQRGEVWRWYWKAWCRTLWRTHLAIFIAVSLSAVLLLDDGVPNSIAAILIAAAIGLVPLIGLIIFPMAKFKPQERMLCVNDRGIDTMIGEISAKVLWHDIAEIRDDEGYLIIRGTNGNAFIVPPRAFQSNEAKSRFRDFITSKVESVGN